MKQVPSVPPVPETGIDRNLSPHRVPRITPIRVRLAYGGGHVRTGNTRHNRFRRHRRCRNPARNPRRAVARDPGDGQGEHRSRRAAARPVAHARSGPRPDTRHHAVTSREWFRRTGFRSRSWWHRRCGGRGHRHRDARLCRSVTDGEIRCAVGAFRWCRRKSGHRKASREVCARHHQSRRSRLFRDDGDRTRFQCGGGGDHRHLRRGHAGIRGPLPDRVGT